MANERSWEAQGPVLFTANGGANGLVTVTSVQNFKVKQAVIIGSNTQPSVKLEIKKIVSPTQFYVGPINSNNTQGNKSNNMQARTNVSMFLVSDFAFAKTISQTKPKIKPDDITQAVYEREPTLAIRSFLVDTIGRGIDSNNPLPVLLPSNAVKQPVITNLNINSNTEHQHQFNPNVKKFLLRPRVTDKIKVAYLPGGTDTQYITVNYGCVYTEEGIQNDNLISIYIKGEKNNTIEIIEWL